MFMSIASTCENMCRRLEQQHEKKIMNYQWERMRDQRVVTDDTRILMRQTAKLNARLLRLLLLALVCCARAQLLVLTLNHVLFLVGHDFLPSLSLSLLLFLCLCLCVYVCMYVLVLRKNEFSDKHVKNDKLPWWASFSSSTGDERRKAALVRCRRSSINNFRSMSLFIYVYLVEVEK